MDTVTPAKRSYVMSELKGEIPVPNESLDALSIMLDIVIVYAIRDCRASQI